MRILIDLDGVVADLHAKWIRVYNDEWGDDLTKARALLTYDLHEHVRPECDRKIYELITRPSFFDDLEPVPGAVEAVRALGDRHEVLICSAPACADSARAKIEWVARVLGLSRKQVILTHRKELVEADVLIDDSPENLLAFRPGGRVAFGYPYNAHLKGQVAYWAADYSQPEWAWAGIVEWIQLGPGPAVERRR